MKDSKNKIVVYDSSTIQEKIFTIRGVQIMLDRDLAELYGVKAIRLREQVKRNKNRFPDDFMFQLNNNEVNYMVSQSAIPSKQHLGGHLPYVFTEQGVSMLSSVLKTPVAVEVSILVVRAFVGMRKFILNNASIFQRLEKVELKQIEADKKFEQIFTAMQNKDLEPKQGIFYDGQIFDAHKFVSGLVRKAKKTILLIDNYVDETVLDLFTRKRKNVVVTILTKRLTRALFLDTKKFNEQYPSLEIKIFNKAHDRFLILDDKDIYHFGAS
ncbi:MAG: ORF6N domain-containing protein [Chlorobi bacterium]|nr:ORF6N domain-containing protein [Chlorobiota bacterium]